MLPLSLCVSVTFLVCCWPLFMLAFSPQSSDHPQPNLKALLRQRWRHLIYSSAPIHVALFKDECGSIMCYTAFSYAVCAFKEYLCFISPHTSRKFSH